MSNCVMENCVAKDCVILDAPQTIINKLKKEIGKYQDLYALLGGDDFFVTNCTPETLLEHVNWLIGRERACVAYAIAEKLGVATQEMADNQDYEEAIKQVKDAAEQIRKERDEWKDYYEAQKEDICALNQLCEMWYNKSNQQDELEQNNEK